jgi:uroporphyrinogen-III synthase
LKVKKILISQPQPADYEKSPYFSLAKKYNLDLTFRKMIRIEGLTASEFRKQKINIPDYTAIIFTCKNAVDNFFRLCTEMRFKMPDTTKYFCVSESTAYYLQKYVQFRKRKIFHGNENSAELMNLIKKHSAEKFLFPCVENVKHEMMQMMSTAKVSFTKAVIYRTVSSDVSDLNLKDFQMLVFFSPFGVEALFENCGTYEQGDQMIAVFGQTTLSTAKEKCLNITVQAPTETAPSMTMALDQFLARNNKK